MYFYLMSIVFAGSESDLQNERIQAVDWAEIEWEKKAPQNSKTEICQPRHLLPKFDQINSPRRASAPFRKNSVETVRRGDLQARRHNSAPILKLRIDSNPMVTLHHVIPSPSPTHVSSPQELFVASPIDYFDPRFATAATPEELKSCGISKESVEVTMKRREDDHLRENLQQGLLTCSLCMNTFNEIEALQAHLQKHFH